jgi:3,4-dihydroxy-2-butanone 4-phosphate synthase
MQHATEKSRKDTTELAAKLMWKNGKTPQTVICN